MEFSSHREPVPSWRQGERMKRQDTGFWIASVLLALGMGSQALNSLKLEFLLLNNLNAVKMHGKDKCIAYNYCHSSDKHNNAYASMLFPLFFTKKCAHLY